MQTIEIRCDQSKQHISKRGDWRLRRNVYRGIWEWKLSATRVSTCLDTRHEKMRVHIRQIKIEYSLPFLFSLLERYLFFVIDPQCSSVIKEEICLVINCGQCFFMYVGTKLSWEKEFIRQASYNFFWSRERVLKCPCQVEMWLEHNNYHTVLSCYKERALSGYNR